eukprot:1409988-Prymnesium_polylepis.1
MSVASDRVVGPRATRHRTIRFSSHNHGGHRQTQVTHNPKAHPSTASVHPAASPVWAHHSWRALQTLRLDNAAFYSWCPLTHAQSTGTRTILLLLVEHLRT